MYVCGRGSLHFKTFFRSLMVGLVPLLVSMTASTVVHAQAKIAQSAEYVPGEVIVKLKGSSKSLQSQAFIGKAVSQNSMALKGSWGGLNMHHFGLKPGQTVEGAMTELQADPAVEYAEPNYIVHKQDVGEPSQPLPYAQFKAQAQTQGASAMSVNAVANSSRAQTTAPIGAQNAWTSQTVGKAPVIVAVIDTGIDFNHSVFTDTGVIWQNSGEIAVNNIDDDGNGYIDDIHGWNFVNNSNLPQDDAGHGTHVSGIILGVSQDIFANQLHSATIRIMPLKFLDSTGSGTTSDAVKAIYYAVNNGAKVLNNSWGGGGFSSSLLDAIAFAYDHKAVFVAAAGNAATNNDQAPTYPANYNVPNIISVAATSDQDGLASFSNYGAQTVHMGSPGVSIYSTLPNESIGLSSGTSMATPFVTGLAAIMLRESPTMSGYQIKSLIFSNADAISSLQTTTITRARLDLSTSLQSAKVTAADATQPAYSASSSNRDPASAGASAGGCGLVVKNMYDSGGDGPTGPSRNITFFALLVILVAPVVVSVILRNREGKNQRRYQRYEINSQVRLKFGDRELLGQVSSISLGGVQLNTDAWLEHGGVVKMSISSPDGRDEIQVEGCVVWSEEQKRYGVAFSNAGETTLEAISRWTQGMLKT
jgi:hypothetical protein